MKRMLNNAELVDVADDGSITAGDKKIYPIVRQIAHFVRKEWTTGPGSGQINLGSDAAIRLNKFIKEVRTDDKLFLQARILVHFTSGNPLSIYVTPNPDTALTNDGLEGSFINKSTKQVVYFGALVSGETTAYFQCGDTSIIDSYFPYIDYINVEYSYALLTDF